MLVESIAILMVLFAMVVIFLRARRKDYAAATAPLLIVPGANALMEIINESVGYLLPIDIRAAIVVAGLAVSVALLGIFCTRFEKKKAKYSYLFLCGGFITLLSMIFLYSIYNPVL